MSEVRVNKLSPRSGTTVTLGDSGDTISIPSGVTLANSGTIDNLNADNLTSGTVPSARISGAYTGITQTGTLASFASTGIDDNATSTAITIDDVDKVKIGTTTDAWSGSNSLVIKEASGDGGITIVSASTTNNGNIGFSDTEGTSFSNMRGLITYLHNGDSMRFMTANTEAMRIDSSGHAIIPAGVTLGTSAGTYNASNTLDDYEEGTWTPSLIDYAGTPTVNEATYTKIGRLVTVATHISLDGTSDGSQYAISGLPFTSGTVASYYGGFVTYTSSAVTHNIYPFLNTGNTSIYLYKTSGNGMTYNDLGTGANLRLVVTYIT